MSEEYDYDLVVVGGGPAGSSAAFAAAKKGVKVALLEKENSIAETVRTSGVTWIQNIKEFGIPDDCFNPIKKFSFCSPNNEVTISDTVSRAAVLDVRKTYRWLANEAAQLGVDVFVKTNIKNVIKNESEDIVGVTGVGPNGEITFHSKVVIDATGFP
ncbi:MAG: NAD(P)/FAD-dependent oxidoreductase, partial [Nitrosopumilus sp.]